jgi:hypothetical protein
VEIISRDAHVAQPMILAVDEVRELTAMFDGGDHLPDAYQDDGEGLADQCAGPRPCPYSRRDAFTHAPLLLVALADHDLGCGALCDDSLLFHHDR